MDKNNILLDKEKALEIGSSCVCYNLRKSARLVTQIYDQALRPLGIKSTQFALLMTIFYQEEITISALAKVLGMDRTTLSRNTKLLEAKGFITIADGNDRREQWISLTPQGLEILKNAIPLWDNAQNAVAGKLGEEKLGTLMSELRVLSGMKE